MLQTSISQMICTFNW